MRASLAILLLAGSVFAQQKITTIAGNGTPGYSDTQINNPYGLAIGPDGGLYICEIGNHVVRRLDLRSGKMITVAGTGKAGYSGDGGPATEAQLNEPYEVTFDRAGNMYFVEMKNHVIRRVDRKGRKISTVAGTGQPGFGGDVGPASKAQMRQPHSIAFDKQGRLLVCDIGNNRIRRIDMKGGTIETIFEGKKGTPTNGPRAIAVAPTGNLYVAFREGNSVYRMNSDNGEMEQLATNLAGPKGIALGKDGVYIADTESHSIRRIKLRGGSVEAIAGTGERGDGPDGDPLACKMNRPHGIFIDKNGVIYIGDSEAHRVRMLR